MQDERDIVVFEDEEGGEFELEVVDYFTYKEQEYVILVDADAQEHEHEHAPGEECDCEDTDMYIMKVIVDGEFEEFMPVEEDMLEELCKVVEEHYSEIAEDDEN